MAKKDTDKKKANIKQSTKNASKKKEAGDIDSRKKDVLRRMKAKSRYGRKRKKRGRREREQKEFDVNLVSIRRVTKVRKGGRRLRLSVMAVIGNKKGKIGVAVAKGKDVRDAERKAVNKAKKHLFTVPLKGQTIPHEVTVKYGAAKVFLKPAAPGTGVIAGGAVRSVVELAGVKDILSKVLGTKNKITNVYATVKALKQLRLSRLKK